jgi:hypothetical protein
VVKQKKALGILHGDLKEGDRAESTSFHVALLSTRKSRTTYHAIRWRHSIISSGRQAALLRATKEMHGEAKCITWCMLSKIAVHSPAQQLVQLSRYEYNFMPIYELHSRWASSFTLYTETHFLYMCEGWLLRADPARRARLSRDKVAANSCLSRCFGRWLLGASACLTHSKLAVIQLVGREIESAPTTQPNHRAPVLGPFSIKYLWGASTLELFRSIKRTT